MYFGVPSWGLNCHSRCLFKHAHRLTVFLHLEVHRPNACVDVWVWSYRERFPIVRYRSLELTFTKINASHALIPKDVFRSQFNYPLKGTQCFLVIAWFAVC